MPFPVNRTVRDIQKEVNKGRRRSSPGTGILSRPRSPTTASPTLPWRTFPSSKTSLPRTPLLAATTATGSSSSMLQTPHPMHPSPPSLHATVTAIAAVAAPHAPHYPAAHQVYFAEQQQPQPVGPIPQAPTSRSTACTAPLTHNIPIKYASSSPRLDVTSLPRVGFDT